MPLLVYLLAPFHWGISTLKLSGPGHLLANLHNVNLLLDVSEVFACLPAALVAVVLIAMLAVLLARRSHQSRWTDQCQRRPRQAGRRQQAWGHRRHGATQIWTRLGSSLGESLCDLQFSVYQETWTVRPCYRRDLLCRTGTGQQHPSALAMWIRAVTGRGNSCSATQGQQLQCCAVAN